MFNKSGDLVEAEAKMSNHMKEPSKTSISILSLSVPSSCCSCRFTPRPRLVDGVFIGFVIVGRSDEMKGPAARILCCQSPVPPANIWGQSAGQNSM